jgi:ribosome biogenesis GTPase
VFVRKEAGRGVSGQVVAANVDLAFLVTALPIDFNPRRLERYIALAYEGGIAPVIVLTKVDLVADEDEVDAAAKQATRAAPGVPIHAVSAVSGRGVGKLEVYFQDRQTVAFLGSSGAGKSTLINRLVGHDTQEVQHVRKDGKGRHTTTHRSLIVRPGGGLVIDTPGMRELALHGGDEGVGVAFSEIEELAARCRFNDCSHREEPGCAVQAAVQDGTLSAERVQSYEKLRRELRYLELKDDPQAFLEQKRRDKAMHRSMYRWLRENDWR